MEELKGFAHKYQNERDFSSVEGAEQLLLNITSFLSSSSWLQSASNDDRLALFSCLRLLMRDKNLLKRFISDNSCICVLVEELKGATHNYLTSSDPDSKMQTMLVMELSNLVQKLSHSPSSHSALIESGAHKQLLFLLSAYNAQILQSSINSLINLGKKLEGRKAILDCYPLDSLLHILEYNGKSIDIQASVSNLLLLLSQETEMRQQVKEQDLLLSCISLIQSSTVGLFVKSRLLEVLEWILNSDELVDEFRELGGIPLILLLINPQSMATNTLDNARILKASLSLLTHLSLDDISARQIVESNGLYFISHYLVQPDADSQLQLYCLRALRYLFSLERNRRLLKHFFPLMIFEKFINIGHYVHSLSAYSSLAESLSGLSVDDKAALVTNQKSLNQTNCPLRMIGEYEVLELLGTGAYGSVYKVRKGPRGSNLHALKEIGGNHPALGLAVTADERNESIGKIKSEVAIIHKKLRHPNIVQYFRCFEESNHLYIEMSLIDGAPLSEFISSLKEKQASFSEKRIWTIFSQIIRALHYIHEEKGITHRDLKPANMILGEQDKLTITDFGLAKDHKDFSLMKSAVGTLTYWCPEIVESKAYNKKADIWAAGCVLYEMAVLQPPFYATNLLSLAKKIAEGHFDMVPLEKYSHQMSEVICKCLTVDSDQRPDSVQIGGMIAEHLMMQLDSTISQLETKSAKDSHSRRNSDAVIELAERSHLLSRRRLSFSSDSEVDSSPSSAGATASSLLPTSLYNRARRGSSPLLTSTTPNVSIPNPTTNTLLPEPMHQHSSPLPLYKRARSTRSGSAVINVPPLSLREIADPISNILQIVHKMIFLFQLSPVEKFGHKSSPAYVIFTRYTRALFGNTSSFDAKDLKNELWKLATGSNEDVALLPPLPHLLAAALVEYPQAPSYSKDTVSYSQLQVFIEEVLKKTNYFAS